jgi:hypothetical protein
VTAFHNLGGAVVSPIAVRIVTNPGRGVQPVAIVSGRSITPFVVESAHKENT